MKLPKKVKIGNKVYKVRKLQGDAPDDVFGRIRYRDLEIAIDPTLHPVDQGETFWHEVVHGLLADGDFTVEHDNEQLVQHLGAGMYQVLKDLKWLPK